jgi:hypothetical protein
MVEAAHGVEGVRGAGRSGPNGRARLGSGCVGVAEADASAGVRGVGDEVERAGNLRGDGEQADVATRGLLKPFEERDGGRLKLCTGRAANSVSLAAGREFAASIALAMPSSARKVRSTGAVTVVARKYATPFVARNPPMLLRASGVASMASWPAAPWTWMSKKAGVNVVSSCARACGPDSILEIVPSSATVITGNLTAPDSVNRRRAVMVLDTRRTFQFL